MAGKSSVLNSVLFVLLAIAWGSNWMFLKIGLGFSPPFWFATIRFAISFAALGVVILIRRPDYRLVKQHFWKIMLAGAVSYGVCYALVYWGQLSISSGTASVLFSSIPLFTAGFSHWYLPEEKTTSRKFLGVVIGFCGITVIYIGDISLHGGSALFGALAISLSSASAAFISVYIKRHLRVIDSLQLTHTQMIPGFVFLAILALTLEDFSSVRLNQTMLISVFYLSLFGTAFSFWAYFYLLARLNVLKLSLVGFLTPIIAVFLGWAVLSETLSSRFVAGSVLVLVGVWISSRETAKGRPANM
jgi:drug/metabolite transporter (DMT)-like permease